MRKRLLTVVAMVLVLVASAFGTALASSHIIYDAIQEPLPSSVASLGYQATQTHEFGNHIEFDGNERSLNTFTVTMVSWACEQGQWQDGDCQSSEGSSFDHPVTVTLYEVAGGSEPAAGDAIASVSQDVTVPYRPSADPNCPDATAWMDSNGECFNGLAFNVDFDFGGVELEDEVIYGIAYNTQTYGDEPIGETGPYNALNVGVTSSNDAPSVGSDVDTDVLFRTVDTNPPSGSPVFGPEEGWSAWTIAVRFDTAPSSPESKNDCKKGGWQDYGFKNQGQCIKFVNTGKDSR